MTMDSRFEIRDSRSEIRDPRFEIPDPRFEIRDSRFEIRDSRFEIRDSRFEIRNPRSEIRDSRFEIGDLEIRDSRFEIRAGDLPTFLSLQVVMNKLFSSGGCRYHFRARSMCRLDPGIAGASGTHATKLCIEVGKETCQFSCTCRLS